MISSLLLPLLARYGLHIAAILAIGVTVATWDRSRVNAGVQKERARVEKIGEKIDAKASVARRKAEARPNDALRGYCRDC